MRKLFERKTVLIVIVCLTVFAGYQMAFAAEKAPQKVVDLANEVLVGYGTDPVIVAAVQEENAKGKTLASIQELDKKWKATPGVADFMKALMESTAGKHLRKLQSDNPYFAEIFVMGNQGGNVAQTDKTSDFWQGDEAKFQKSFNGGVGAVHISDVEFDDSTQAYIVQVSVPVKDNGKVIGAITFGVDVDKI